MSTSINLLSDTLALLFREHEIYLRLESSSCPLSQLAFLLSCEWQFQNGTRAKDEKRSMGACHKWVRQKEALKALVHNWKFWQNVKMFKPVHENAKTYLDARHTSLAISP